MVAIIDYGMGNLLSVKNALDYLGEDNIICSTPDQLAGVDKLILPGIGGFPDCMQNLTNSGFIPILNNLVLTEKMPIMGICLGMQVMARLGTEFKNIDGLGWFDAEIVNINTVNNQAKIPNVGWEDIVYNRKSPLFKKLPARPDFYLVHSFFMKFPETDTHPLMRIMKLMASK